MIIIYSCSCFSLGVTSTGLLELVKSLKYGLPVVVSEADNLLEVHVRRPNPVGGRKLICGCDIVTTAVEVVPAFNLKKR